MTDIKPQLVIIDLGSQYTHVIGRELLSLGFTSVILRPDQVVSYLSNTKPRGIILSGGAASVYDENAPLIPSEIFSLSCPILGICFGMQYMAYREDKTLVVGSAKSGKEYGPLEIMLEESALFKGLGKKLKVWASHGDVVCDAPEGFRIIARSNDVIEGIENGTKHLYGVQFHPEVLETEDNNLILKNFADDICGCHKNWEPLDRIKEIQDAVLKKVGNGKAAIGVSGGVDSTTLAALLSPVLHDKLYPFFIDTGGMRHNEVEDVRAMCRTAGIDLHIIDAKKDFFSVLSGITDAEEKRKRFKDVYKPIFNTVIKENNITHILQGTLATDLIESGSLGGASMIKSHHNVGLGFDVEELAPFAGLFKHEVREIARMIGLEEAVSERKPFPGPGLFIRIVGVAVTPELIEKVRTADHIVTEILKKEDFYKDISQVVVALLGAKTVGVQGDSRSYEYPIVVRAISSTDFMTVKGVEIPSEVRRKIISEVTKHGFNRIFFDETPKPPATTELE
ncbi:MAG: glutamine-hydrolyzing GMP synthase [Patescibacteria group bacterium]